MFRARDYYRTSGFDEKLSNAVDYDLALKLGERGYICSLPDVLYRYRIHGRNTSLVNLEAQRRNHARVVAAALGRRGLSGTLSGSVDEDALEILPAPAGLPVWRRKLLHWLYCKYARAARAARTGHVLS